MILVAVTGATALAVLASLPQRAAPLAVQETSPPRTPAVSCDRRSEVAVIAGAAYPPTLAAPDAGEPFQCFADLAGARAAGFDLPPEAAALPFVDGVYLHRADPFAARLCQKAAAGAGRDVPCPARLPYGGRLSGCGWCVLNGTHLLHYSAFPVPDGWCDGCLPQVVVAALPKASPPTFDFLVTCGTAGVRSTPGRFVQCRPNPPGKLHIHAGHTLRRGTLRGLDVVVSVEGYGRRSRRLAAAVFKHLDFVGADGS